MFEMHCQLQSYEGRVLFFRATQAKSAGSAYPNYIRESYPAAAPIFEAHLDWDRVVIDSAAPVGYERCLQRYRTVVIDSEHSEMLAPQHRAKIMKEMLAELDQKRTSATRELDEVS
jgi:thioesterase domain-containing protein